MLGLNTYAKTKNKEAVSVIPQLRVSAMDCLSTGFNFIVTLNEITFGFQSVVGLGINRKVSYLTEGGVNDHQIMVGCPSDDNPTLTFKRGILMRNPESLISEALAAASVIPDNMERKMALIAAVSCDAQACLERGPALGTIQVFDRQRSLKALYSFLSLGMTSWKSDDLDATSGGIMCEEFTIAHTGLTRHPLDPIPQLVRAGMNTVSDIITLSNSELTYSKAKESKERRKAAEELKKKKEEELKLLRKQKEEERLRKEEEENLKNLQRQLEEQQRASKA